MCVDHDISIFEWWLCFPGEELVEVFAGEVCGIIYHVGNTVLLMEWCMLLNYKTIKLNILSAVPIMLKIIQILLNFPHKLIHRQWFLIIQIKLKDRNNMPPIICINMRNKSIQLTQFPHNQFHVYILLCFKCLDYNETIILYLFIT